MGDGRKERGAVRTEARGDEDPCGMVPRLCEVGGDLFRAEVMRSRRSRQAKIGSLAECIGRHSRSEEKEFRSI